MNQYKGGIPDSVFNHPAIQDHIKSGNAANGGGWIGRLNERTEARDKALIYDLWALKLGDDFVAIFLTTIPGRLYAEAIDGVGSEFYGHPRHPQKLQELLGNILQEGTKNGWLQVEFIKSELP